MSRKLSIQYLGAIYLVVSCGDHSENILCDDEDRQRFMCDCPVCSKVWSSAQARSLRSKSLLSTVSLSET
jgi:hypothetical protein